MALGKVVLQVTCPNCHMSARQGSPYCDRCGAPLSNVPAVPIHSGTTQRDQVDVQDAVIRRFLNEEQDPALARQSYDKASQILTEGEEIEYIAIANKTVIGMMPDCVVVTDRRLIAYKKRILGKVALDDCFWRDVLELQIRETRHGVSLVLETIQGWKLTVESLPRTQAWRLYEIGATHNMRLRTKLEQLLVEVQAREDAQTAALEAAWAAEATALEVVVVSEVPLPPHESNTLEPETSTQPEPERAVVVEPLPLPLPLAAAYSSPSSTGPLPMFVPPIIEASPVREWQMQPALHAEQLPSPSLSATSTPLSGSDYSLLGGLDDLFSPTLQKEVAVARLQEEGTFHEPISIPVASRAPMTQLEPVVSVEQPRDQSAHKPATPTPIAAYQMSVQHSPLAMASNGSSGSNGNGVLHLAKNDLHLKGNGLLTEELAPVELVEAAPKAIRPEAPRVEEPRQADASATPIPPSTPNTATSTEPKRASGPNESPMRKLKQLKRMLDVGLITQVDYEAKKADILSRI